MSRALRLWGAARGCESVRHNEHEQAARGATSGTGTVRHLGVSVVADQVRAQGSAAWRTV